MSIISGTIIGIALAAFVIIFAGMCSETRGKE